VNLCGEEFLAGAGFAEQQHRRIRLGDLLNLVEDAKDCLALSNNQFGAQAIAHLSTEIHVFGIQLSAQALHFRKRPLQRFIGTLTREDVGKRSR
jgi:hypothetical protein